MRNRSTFVLALVIIAVAFVGLAAGETRLVRGIALAVAAIGGCGVGVSVDAALADVAGRQRRVRSGANTQASVGAWWLLPLCCGLFGGLVGYVALRGRSTSAANRVLVVGVVVSSATGVAVLVLAALAG